MSSLAAIDVEASEAAVLIDYENIRISWERLYGRLFTYADLCWLCDLAEKRFRCSIGRVVVFMSDPEECEQSCSPEQVMEMRRSFTYLQEDQTRSCTSTLDGFPSQPRLGNFEADDEPLSSTKGQEHRSRKRRRRWQSTVVVDLASSDDDSAQPPSRSSSFDNSGISVSSDSNSTVAPASPITSSDEELKYEANINGGAVKRCCPLIDVDADEKEIEIVDQVDKQSLESPILRLGQGSCKGAQVIVRVFRYKLRNKTRVQKGCDVVIGSQVTSLCYMPRFSSIILFSADGDFEDTCRECIQASADGGVMRFAKPVRILGFSHAFERSRFRKAKNAFLEWKTLRKHHYASGGTEGNFNPPQMSDSATVDLYLIDYEFPCIRRVLTHTNRPLISRLAYRSRKPCRLSETHIQSEVTTNPVSAITTTPSPPQSSSHLNTYHHRVNSCQTVPICGKFGFNRYAQSMNGSKESLPHSCRVVSIKSNHFNCQKRRRHNDSLFSSRSSPDVPILQFSTNEPFSTKQNSLSELSEISSDEEVDDNECANRITSLLPCQVAQTRNMY